MLIYTIFGIKSYYKECSVSKLLKLWNDVIMYILTDVVLPLYLKELFMLS